MGHLKDSLFAPVEREKNRNVCQTCLHQRIKKEGSDIRTDRPPRL